MSAHTAQAEQNPEQATGAVTAYIALGSNIGDRRGHLDHALAAVAELPGIYDLISSPYYETDPVGPQDQDKFINAAARFETTLSAQALLEQLLKLERRLGRPPREERRHWGPREIDVDLLLHDDTVLNLPGLILPHPRLHERTFVLQPLCDIAADVRHPRLGRTVLELLAEIQNQAEVSA